MIYFDPDHDPKTSVKRVLVGKVQTRVAINCPFDQYWLIPGLQIENPYTIGTLAEDLWLTFASDS